MALDDPSRTPTKRLLQGPRTASGRWLWLRKLPSAVQDLRARAVEAHAIVPALHDRQAVLDLAVTAAELDVDRELGNAGP